MMRMASSRVSPLAKEVEDMSDRLMQLPPRRYIAVWKEKCVRVEGSKKSVARILPRHKSLGPFITSHMSSATSKTRLISELEKSSTAIKSRPFNLPTQTPPCSSG